MSEAAMQQHQVGYPTIPTMKRGKEENFRYFTTNNVQHITREFPPKVGKDTQAEFQFQSHSNTWCPWFSAAIKEEECYCSGIFSLQRQGSKLTGCQQKEAKSSNWSTQRTGDETNFKFQQGGIWGWPNNIGKTLKLVINWFTSWSIKQENFLLKGILFLVVNNRKTAFKIIAFDKTLYLIFGGGENDLTWKATT